MKLIEETDEFECPKCGGDSVRQILMPMGEEKFYRCDGSISKEDCEFSWKESEAWKFMVRERRERYYSSGEYERLKGQRRIFFRLTEQTELDLDLNCIACGTRPHEKDKGHMIHVIVPYTGYNSWTLIHDKCLEKHEGNFEPPPVGKVQCQRCDEWCDLAVMTAFSVESPEGRPAGRYKACQKCIAEAEGKVELVFIVNGEDVSVKSTPMQSLRGARNDALRFSGNTGRHSNDWEVRDINGRLMVELDGPVRDIASGSRFFLTLKVGAGG